MCGRLHDAGVPFRPGRCVADVDDVDGLLRVLTGPAASRIGFVPLRNALLGGAYRDGVRICVSNRGDPRMTHPQRSPRDADRSLSRAVLCVMLCWLNPLVPLRNVVRTGVEIGVLVHRDNRTMTPDHLALCQSWHRVCWLRCLPRRDDGSWVPLPLRHPASGRFRLRGVPRPPTMMTTPTLDRPPRTVRRRRTTTAGATEDDAPPGHRRRRRPTGATVDPATQRVEADGIMWRHRQWARLLSDDPHPPLTASPTVSGLMRSLQRRCACAGRRVCDARSRIGDRWWYRTHTPANESDTTTTAESEEIVAPSGEPSEPRAPRVHQPSPPSGNELVVPATADGDALGVVFTFTVAAGATSPLPACRRFCRK